MFKKTFIALKNCLKIYKKKKRLNKYFYGYKKAKKNILKNGNNATISY